MVRAQLKIKLNWDRLYCNPLLYQVTVLGTIGTNLSDPGRKEGPVQAGKWQMTRLGRSLLASVPSLYTRYSTVPLLPLTSLASVQRFKVRTTLAPFDRNSVFLRPCADSLSKAEAPGLFSAFSFAMGFPVFLRWCELKLVMSTFLAQSIVASLVKLELVGSTIVARSWVFQDSQSLTEKVPLATLSSCSLNSSFSNPACLIWAWRQKLELSNNLYRAAPKFWALLPLLFE